MFLHFTFTIHCKISHSITYVYTEADEISYLNKKLNEESFLKQIKFVGNEWIKGWETMKGGEWKQEFRKLCQSPSFFVRLILWILR